MSTFCFLYVRLFGITDTMDQVKKEVERQKTDKNMLDQRLDELLQNAHILSACSEEVDALQKQLKQVRWAASDDVAALEKALRTAKEHARKLQREHTPCISMLETLRKEIHALDTRLQNETGKLEEREREVAGFNLEQAAAEESREWSAQQIAALEAEIEESKEREESQKLLRLEQDSAVPCITPDQLTCANDSANSEEQFESALQLAESALAAVEMVDETHEKARVEMEKQLEHRKAQHVELEQEVTGLYAEIVTLKEEVRCAAIKSTRA